MPIVVALSAIPLLVMGLATTANAAPVPAGIAAARQPCTIVGTSGPDRLYGTKGVDVICGLGGDDEIDGRGGDDVIRGGAGDDDLVGGDGDDSIIGEDGADRITPGTGLGNTPDVHVVPILRYRLLPGSKVAWDYSAPSGNCINHYETQWTDVVNSSGAFDSGHDFFFVTQGGSCTFQTSRGTWIVTVTSPSGATKSGSVKVETDTPNPFTDGATTTCYFPAGIDCTGGTVTSGSASGRPLHPELTISNFVEPGPAPGPTPTPTPPTPTPSDQHIECQRETSYKVGEVLNEKNGHLCSISGYPLSSLTFDNLPPGITAARWPSATDGWIVFAGKVSKPWSGSVQIHATQGRWTFTTNTNLRFG